MLNKLLYLNILLLMAAALFDPSDLLFTAKVPLFVTIWIIVLVDLTISKKGQYPVPSKLYVYLFIFVLLLPLLGLFVYLLRGANMEEYDGFKYFKAYLFLSLCIPLSLKRIDLTKPLSSLLTGLSLATIFIYTFTLDNPLLREQLTFFGNLYTIFSLTDRTYGPLTYESVYFHASPLIVVAIVYFCYQFLHSEGRPKRWNLLLLLVNICAMVLSGTRNNMIVALFAPLLVIAWYRRGKPRFAISAFLALVVAIGLGAGVFQAMFNPDEYSNSVKLGHLHDYATLFNDWPTLLFGQGLGASFFSTVWGMRVSLTEVTYVEFIRNYGLMFSPILFALVFYPLRVLGDPKARQDHYLFLGYLCYLYLCSANPLLLSSTGMLLLSIVLFKTFCRPNET